MNLGRNRERRAWPQAGGPAAAGGHVRPGFSLIELLVVVAVVLLLTVLAWGPATGTRQKKMRAACQNNLAKIYVAMNIYANEHGGRYPETAGVSTSAQALDPLVPRYSSDTSSFLCPASGDSPLPGGEPIRQRKISYAYYMGRAQTNGAVALMSDRQVDTRARAAEQQAFSTNGKPPGNNHPDGGNFLYCDGSTWWTRANVPFALDIPPGVTLLNP
jgi:prepilin-type N-terminal cleavage/methylation domain-containing protein/prepilin-type processing-associated H-X9-DG protein